MKDSIETGASVERGALPRTLTARQSAPQVCGRMVELGFNMRRPCAYVRPCPIHPKRAMLAALVVLASLWLCVPVQAIGFPPSQGYEFPLAERATGRTTICLSQGAFTHLAYRNHVVNADAFWLPSERAIVTEKGECLRLAHPSLDPGNTAWAVFVLGHEAAHARQQDLGLPFSEHQADCWSLAGFQRLRIKLGIKRHLTTVGLGINGNCR